MRFSYSADEEEIYSRLNYMRGGLAFIVLLSHIWGYTEIIFLVPFNKIVTIAVAFFFFLSGYGMTRSYIRKKDYLREVILIKIPFLCWMAVLAYFFSAIFEKILIWGEKSIINTIYLPIGIKSLITSTNWYVYELMGFYILFIFCKRFMSEKTGLILIACVSIVAFFILFYMGVVEAYYNSIIGFGLGMLCGKQEYCGWMIKYPKGYSVGCIFLIISFLAMMVMDKTTIIFAIIRNFAAFGAIIVVLYIIRYIDIKNVFWGYFSRISPEIYFYHMPIAVLLSQIIEDKVKLTVLITVLTLLSASVISKVNQWIHKKIRRICL